MSIGSFEHRKGHDVLIRAFQKVVRRHRDVALLLVGKPGPVSGQIREMIEDAQLESDIQILENVPHREIHDLLTRSTVFVLASRWQKGRIGEGFAIAILEAAAAGVPVVATASCGVRELIEDGVTGRVVPLEDHDELANAICEMLENPPRAAYMAENLRRLVSDRFTWRGAADKYLDLCRELA